MVDASSPASARRRIIHATWSLQGYFIASFEDKTILVMHPSGKRYWINNEMSKEWFGSIFHIPRPWRPYLLQAISLRNNCAQYPIWFNRQSNKYEIIQLADIAKKIRWPRHDSPAIDEYLMVDPNTYATVLYSLDKAAAFILYRQLIQVCISVGKLLHRGISTDVENWVQQQRPLSYHVEKPFVEDDLIIQTFPIDHCPSFFLEPLSLIVTDIDQRRVEEEQMQQQQLLRIIHRKPTIPLDQVIQSKELQVDDYRLDQGIVAFVQYQNDTFFWFTVSRDSVTIWNVTTWWDILHLCNAGRIVEKFSPDNSHLVYSIHGMPPRFHASWATILQAAMQWRTQVKTSLTTLLQQQQPPSMDATRPIRHYKQQRCSVESFGDFKLDTQGYLSCHVRDGTFILFHPKHPYAIVVSHRGNEYRIRWRSTVYFRHYFEKIYQIYDYLLLSPRQKREIERQQAMRQRWMALQLRNLRMNRRILLESPPSIVVS